MSVLSALQQFVGIFEHPFFNESPSPSSSPKRLPADYALKHHIKTLKATYDNIVMNMSMALETIGYEDYDLNKCFARRAARNALKLFKFLVDPMSTNLFMYQRGFKEYIVNVIAKIWTNDALEAYVYLGPQIIYDVKTVAVLAITAIEHIPFIRHIE